MSGPEAAPAGDLAGASRRGRDAILGIGLPVLCLAFDPIVFRETFPGDRAIQRLKLLSRIVDLDALVLAYDAEKRPARKARLASAYRKATGGEVEERLNTLLD